MHSALQSENVQFGDEVALFALRAKTNVCVERLRRGLQIEEISEQTYRVRTRAVRYFLSCMEFRTRTSLYLRRCVTRKKISKAHGGYFLTHFTIGEHVVKK